MKSKIIKNNVLILLISIFILFIASYILINNNNLRITEKHLINYTKLINTKYNGNNETELINDFETIDDNIRLTFINVDGDVRFDSDKNTDENHIDRPEIKNLGSVHIRYSNTLKMKMMYYALRDINGNYIRLAIPIASNTQFIESFLLAMLFVSMIIIILMGYLVKKTTDISMKPLNVAVKELGNIVGNNNLQKNIFEIETITSEVLEIKSLLQNHVNNLYKEKDKLSFIINNMNQGLIVIDTEREIFLINDYACNLFNYEYDKIVNKDFIFLTRNEKILSALEKTLNDNINEIFDVKMEERTFSFEICGIDNNWLTKSINKNGALIIINDVTEKRNLENSKRDFFANASHELKSPLTSIIGFLEMITSKVITNNEEIIDVSMRSLNEAKRIKDLINEMLSLSRLENINYKYSQENVNLKEVVEEVVNNLTPQIKLKNILISMDLDQAIYYANKEHMYELIRNLIDNAIKYNIDNGIINISLKQEENIVLKINDTGYGIPKEEQLKIFERFYRVDKGRSKIILGTGLGLAIVKHICVLYNAKIELKSQINKGTEFSIIF